MTVVGGKDFNEFATEVQAKITRNREIIERLCNEHRDDWKKLYAALEKEFGWTEQQAYVATEDWYRPENTN